MGIGEHFGANEDLPRNFLTLAAPDAPSRMRLRQIAGDTWG
jgi:hypothetical protein